MFESNRLKKKKEKRVFLVSVDYVTQPAPGIANFAEIIFRIHDPDEFEGSEFTLSTRSKDRKKVREEFAKAGREKITKIFYQRKTKTN